MLYSITLENYTIEYDGNKASVKRIYGDKTTHIVYLLVKDCNKHCIAKTGQTCLHICAVIVDKNWIQWRLFPKDTELMEH